MSEPTSAISTPASRYLYVFLDEAGNLDFSSNGTRYFLLGALTKERPFNAYKELTELKYDLVESGTALEYFHAAQDRQAVRDSVFQIIRSVIKTEYDLYHGHLLDDLT